MTLTVFELIVVYGIDSSAVMTISVLTAIRKYYDQNSLFPRWSYLATFILSVQFLGKMLKKSFKGLFPTIFNL